jgi:hypothetical protein
MTLLSHADPIGGSTAPRPAFLLSFVDSPMNNRLFVMSNLETYNIYYNNVRMELLTYLYSK